jgi:hypothetical protein
MIEYKFVRVEPLIDRATNNVIKWVIGMTAKDTDTNTIAYIDTVKDVTDQKPLSQWTTDEIRDFCLQVALDNNWYDILANQIDNLNNQPILGQNVQI